MQLSACPQSFCPQVPMTQMTDGRTMVIGEIITQVKFIMANVPSPLISLPADMEFNEIAMHTNNDPYIEQLLKIGSHLYAAAMVLPGLHNPGGLGGPVNTD
eukprot:4328493-Amphidinium_carterae.1